MVSGSSRDTGLSEMRTLILALQVDQAWSYRARAASSARERGGRVSEAVLVEEP